MNRQARPLFVALLLAATPFALPLPAQAQTDRIWAGWSAGLSDVGSLNPDASGPELSPGLGYIVGIHAGRWYGESGRLGLRAQGAFQQPTFRWNAADRDITAVSLDLSVLVRLLTPRGGARVLPWLAAGFGGIWYDLGTGPRTSFPAADTFHDGGSQVQPVGVLGAGVDIPTGFHWGGSKVGIRLEVADHVALRSPLMRISDDSRHGAVHHLRFTLGLQSAFSN